MSHPGRTWLTAVSVVALLAQPAPAQLDKYSWGKPAVKVSTPAPKSSGRARRPAPKRTVAPFLMLQWRVLKMGGEGDLVAGEANPNAVFYTGDRIRFGVTANQNGYLYVISQTEDENGRVLEAPSLVFPNSQTNGGRNYVQKNVEFLLPSERAMVFTPPAGRVILWLVFARSAVTELPNEIIAQGAQVVDQNYVNGLKTFSAQKLVRESKPDIDVSKGESPYVIWVQNQDPKQNQTLVEQIVLRNEDRPADPGAQ